MSGEYWTDLLLLVRGNMSWWLFTLHISIFAVVKHTIFDNHFKVFRSSSVKSEVHGTFLHKYFLFPLSKKSIALDSKIQCQVINGSSRLGEP